VRLAEERAVVVGADIKTEGHAETVAMVEISGTTPGQSVTTAFDGMWHGNSIRSIQAA